MSGVVFHHIAEGVMARHLKLSVNDAHDVNSDVIPDVKNGNIAAASQVLTQLGINTNHHWGKTSSPIWGTSERHGNSVALSANKLSKKVVPDVTGMGARDAVYLLESRGVKAIIKGRGKVKSQSIYSGTSIKQGMTCELYME
jgi:cell division protein FtsI (penicillin-binding protein 3)